MYEEKYVSTIQYGNEVARVLENAVHRRLPCERRRRETERRHQEGVHEQ